MAKSNAVARRGLIADCPTCSAPNIICIAAAELNQTEISAIKDLMPKEEMAHLFIAPGSISCKTCNCEFAIEVSNEYYYEGGQI